MGDEPLKYKEEPIMAKTGLEIINSPESTAEKLAAIMANGHPTFEEGGAVACDKVSCEQCWLAWLTPQPWSGAGWLCSSLQPMSALP